MTESRIYGRSSQLVKQSCQNLIILMIITYKNKEENIFYHGEAWLNLDALKTPRQLAQMEGYINIDIIEERNRRSYV
jgi:hypothetical protein